MKGICDKCKKDLEIEFILIDLKMSKEFDKTLGKRFCSKCGMKIWDR